MVFVKKFLCSLKLPPINLECFASFFGLSLLCELTERFPPSLSSEHASIPREESDLALESWGKCCKSSWMPTGSRFQVPRSVWKLSYGPPLAEWREPISESFYTSGEGPVCKVGKIRKLTTQGHPEGELKPLFCKHRTSRTMWLLLGGWSVEYRNNRWSLLPLQETAIKGEPTRYSQANAFLEELHHAKFT